MSDHHVLYVWVDDKLWHAVKQRVEELKTERPAQQHSVSSVVREALYQSLQEKPA